EYEGASGAPEWIDPQSPRWNYGWFGRRGAHAVAPDETIVMTVTQERAAVNGFSRWLINGIAFPRSDMRPTFSLRRGQRYRLRVRNATEDVHPIHLHRHTFEITRIAGQATGGVLKDVVMLGAYQEVEVDFTPSPGLSLFHCHVQIHMDYGFMALF